MIRDDAKYYVEQLLSKDKPEINEKRTLFQKVLGIDKRLIEMAPNYSGHAYEQLLYCTSIRYIRKVALDSTISLSPTETDRTLRRMLQIMMERKAGAGTARA